MSSFAPVDAWVVVQPNGHVYSWLVRPDREWAIEAFSSIRSGPWSKLESQGYRCVPCVIIPKQES